MFLKLANICFKNIKFPRGNYLAIRLWARDFCRVIVDEGAARVNYPAIEIESEII